MELLFKNLKPEVQKQIEDYVLANPKETFEKIKKYMAAEPLDFKEDEVNKAALWYMGELIKTVLDPNHIKEENSIYMEPILSILGIEIKEDN